MLGGALMLGTVAQAATERQVADIDLSKAFVTPEKWRFLATQGRPVPDLVYPGQQIPGLINFCLRASAAGACHADILATPRPEATVDYKFYEPHYLREARLVYPNGASRPPLLLVQSASGQGGDGDQLVFTQLLAYRSGRFERVYAQATGHNNNQDVRYVNSGPVKGSVIFAEPTCCGAPFGFWVTVSRLTPDYVYKTVLRYRSATRYNDGNSLAVIDSEMPNIQKRLRLWKKGSPLPLPAGPCPKPRLSKMELWCK
jgi:hypothetical protein